MVNPRDIAGNAQKKKKKKKRRKELGTDVLSVCNTDSLCFMSRLVLGLFVFLGGG